MPWRHRHRAFGSNGKLPRAEWEELTEGSKGAFTGNSTCQGTKLLVLLFSGSWEEACILMDNRSAEGASKLANTSRLTQPHTKQSSFPMLRHEIDYMTLPFLSEAVFGCNQCSKATQHINLSHLSGICLLHRDK